MKILHSPGARLKRQRFPQWEKIKEIACRRGESA